MNELDHLSRLPPSVLDEAEIAQRVAHVRERIAAAAKRAGRDPGSIKLIAASKHQPVSALVAALRAGVQAFGENTVQEMITKVPALARAGFRPEWHFVGRLQRNKINALLPSGPIIHSIDSYELARAVAQRAQRQDMVVPMLVQVNIGAEPQKGGVLPDEAVAVCMQIHELQGCELIGLMAVPPASEDPRRYFEAMVELRGHVVVAGCTQCRELSMGMSGDFEIGVGVGATMVRVGEAIFGSRRPQSP